MLSQLRSSRHTRAAEHSGQSRNRGGLLDYDPTDGLPIRKYVLESIKIDQDSALEPNDTSLAAVKQNDAFPWPDQQLPTYYDQLPLHSQELLRRARQGDRDARTSVWDKKSGEWVRAEKARARGLGPDVLKSRHLMNIDAVEGEDDNDDDEDEDEDDEEGTGNGIVPPLPAKKRKAVGNGVTERIVEVKKWSQLSWDRADKMPEPKYLADRKPGMPNFYAPKYLKNAVGYGVHMDGGANSVATFDLGDGSGLGSALGGGTAVGGAETPAKRNMPPKRKKKKLGGPGRKKKEVLLAEEAARRAAAEGVDGAVRPEIGEADEKKAEGAGDADDDEGSGEDSGEKGSEEGEVNEDESAPADSLPVESAPELTAEPPMVEVHEPAVNEVTMTEVEISAPEEVDVPATEEAEVVAPEQVEPVAAVAPAEMAAAAVVADALQEQQEAEAPTIDLLGGLEAAVEGMEKAE